MHEVPLSTTIMFSLLLAAMIASLAFEEKIHAKKSLIVGLFAGGSVLLAAFMGLFNFGEVTLPGGHHVNMPVYIPAIDWGVIVIILGSSIFVDVTSRSGLFTWIAIKLTKASHGNPLKLLWYYGLMTVVFSAVLNNVTAMIIVGSLTWVSLNKLEQKEKLLAFLLIEGLLTNIGGLLTLISSVPNIIVGNAAGISFMSFFLKSSPFVLVTTVLTIWLGAKMFAIRPIKDPKLAAIARERVEAFDENDGIHSRNFFWFSALMLFLFIVSIAMTSATPVIQDLGMGFVAMFFAVLMLVRYRHEVDEFYRAIDWDLIIFFVGLFVVIFVMEQALVLDKIGELLAHVMGEEESLFGTSFLLISSSVFSSVTDNIPLAAMLAKILTAQGASPESPLWWAVIFGANLGGNITPIGSASTLVAVTIMHKHGLKVSFVGFIKKAIPFALIQITLATIYVLVFF